MLTSLALIFLAGLTLADICQRVKLPRVIGVLMAGILLGPYALGALDASILSISAELRQMALVIILIKAGLSLNIEDLKKVGRPAILMSFLPALFEIVAFILLAPSILHIDRIEAAVMGAVLGAVSPAVVVPRMVQMMDEGYGTDKRIPQMILAGASLDDVFVIVLFSFVFVLGGGGGGNGFGMLPEAAEKPLHTQDQGFVLDFSGGCHAVGAVPVVFAHPPHGFAALGAPGQDADIFDLRALQPAGHVRPGALGLVEV